MFTSVFYLFLPFYFIVLFIILGERSFPSDKIKRKGSRKEKEMSEINSSSYPVQCWGEKEAINIKSDMN